jgi:predicted amidohydrolase YtcJ
MNNPDFVLANARIMSIDHAELISGSITVRNGRIVSLDHNQAQTLPTSIEIFDMEQRVIVPGLVDSHIHLLNYAHSFLKVDCEVGSLEECLKRVRDQSEQSQGDGWIQGHGWNQNQWLRFGTARDLDQVSIHRPMYLTAKSLHAAWVNSKALDIAGIDSSTHDPEGGEIQRDDEGNPTGILLETAMQLVANHIPHPTESENEQAILAAQTQLLQYGITGLHDFDGPDCFRALQSLHANGELSMRVVKNIRVEYLAAAIELGLRSGFGDDWIRIGNIKIFTDGALGPHTAAMIEPYDGEKSNRGILLMESEELTNIGVRSAIAGFGLTVHAIGDRANHITLNAIEALRQEETKLKLPRRRHRIEHLQLLHPDDLQRPSTLGIVASMQPIHATSDMDVADKFWGSRVQHSYAWRTIQESGAQLTFGSDAPVENPNPFLGIHAAVTRKRTDATPEGEGWIPEQNISVFDALRAYTFGPAYAAGQENQFGRIANGYHADLIILEENPFEISPDRLHSLKPVGTMVAGKWHYKAF